MDWPKFGLWPEEGGPGLGGPGGGRSGRRAVSNHYRDCSHKSDSLPVEPALRREGSRRSGGAGRGRAFLSSPATIFIIS